MLTIVSTRLVSYLEHLEVTEPTLLVAIISIYSSGNETQSDHHASLSISLSTSHLHVAHPPTHWPRVNYSRPSCSHQTREIFEMSK